ncbi:uncharacterized protein [Cherax quadricarinatus]|uniref:uncharacterized protein isoform X2 n=1 Tax=Cherax quadricarinatus TaxID=27406 RepID=UPI00387E4696
MGAKSSTPTSAEREKKPVEAGLPPQILTLLDSQARYIRQNPLSEVDLGLGHVPETTDVPSTICQERINEIKKESDKATPPGEFVGRSVEMVAAATSIPRQTVAGYAEKCAAAALARQALACHLERSVTTTIPQKTVANYLEKDDTTTIPRLIADGYANKDIPSIPQKTDAINVTGNDMQETFTGNADGNKTNSKLQQDFANAGNFLAEPIISRQQVTELKCEESDASQNQLDRAVLQNLACLSKVTMAAGEVEVTENLQWDASNWTRCAENISENKSNVIENNIPKAENYKGCDSEPQLFTKTQLDSTDCVKNLGNSEDENTVVTMVSEQDVQAAEWEKISQFLEKNTHYPKKASENQLSDKILKDVATEQTHTHEETGICTCSAVGPVRDASVKMNDKDRNVAEYKQHKDNRTEGKFLKGENKSRVSESTEAFENVPVSDSVKARDSVSVSDSVKTGAKEKHKQIICNIKESEHLGNAFAGQQSFDSTCEMTVFSREISLAKLSSSDIVQRRWRDEKPQNQRIYTSENIENLSLSPKDRVQNLSSQSLCVSSRDRSQGLEVSARVRSPGSDVPTREGSQGSPVSTRERSQDSPVSTRERLQDSPVSTRERSQGSPVSTKKLSQGSPVSTRRSQGSPVSTRSQGSPVSTRRSQSSPVSTRGRSQVSCVSTKRLSQGSPVSTRRSQGSPVSTRSQGSPVSTRRSQGSPVSTRERSQVSSISTRQSQCLHTPPDYRSECSRMPPEYRSKHSCMPPEYRSQHSYMPPEYGSKHSCMPPEYRLQYSHPPPEYRSLHTHPPPEYRLQHTHPPPEYRSQGSHIPRNSSVSSDQGWPHSSVSFFGRCRSLSVSDEGRSLNRSVHDDEMPRNSNSGRQENSHISRKKDTKENLWKMKSRSTKEENVNKGKTTEVYVKFAETLDENIDIFGYIANRLPPGREFTLMNRTIDPNTRNTIVTLQCKSKNLASRLKAELKKGNNKCQTKILCFDTLQEASGFEMKKQQEVEKSFEQHVQQIKRRSESVLAEHYEKLSVVECRIQEMQHTRTKYMSIREFEAQSGERRALQDKEKELNLQKEEFLKYLKNALIELDKAKESIHFEKIASETRLNLAIECNRLSSAFPIYARRTDILDTVKNNQVSVIIGETGSGKSTQLAQYFFQGGLAKAGMIACTQPRKIAASTLAVHVAKELGTAVGQLVGYKVGMQTRTTNSTKILYMTDHILLNECLQDQNLSAFSCIIIDEAHERSIYTDLLLGMIKECLQNRPDLHLVITSATINPEVFVKYFKECPVLSVSGRMFPVEVEWKEPVMGAESFGNYQEEAILKTIDVHQSEGKGDILVFLTSPLETEKCCERFQGLMNGKPVDYVTLQLHGRLQGDEQQKVFDPVPGNKRKIVFATNCAETSVTIPGIKYVIDTGLVKEMKFDPIRKMSTLAVTMVTQSSAKQRQGRAGRLGPGKCFRLYTEDDFKKMNPDSLPEILRVHIGHAMLKLMELGVDPLKFDYIMSPSVDAMEEAFKSLVHIGAVSERKMTELGKWIAKMPFDPKYGAFVYEAVQAGAGLEAIIIAAASGTSSLFYRAGTNEEKEKADRHKIRFCHEGGDQLTLLTVFREWHKIMEKEKGKWCCNHYINGKSIKGVRETTNEVLHTLKKEMKVDIKFSFGKPETLDNLLVGLLFKSLARNLSHYLGHAKAGYTIVSTKQRVEIHPSSASISLGSQPEWIVFDQVMRTSRDFAMLTTPVSEALVLKGIEDGWLQLEIEEAKKKIITVACQEYVGNQMFREFVGPRYINMRNLETELSSKFSNSLVIVEAYQDKGELKILSNERSKVNLSDSLSNVLAPHRANFELEESEERIGSVSTDVCVRAVIGAGGNTVNVFMPEEFKIVKIHCTAEIINELSKEDVLKHFDQYGHIKECKKYYHKQKSTVWGQINFEKTESAVKAVRETKGKDLNAFPNVRIPVHGINGLRTKIQWCRRRSRGFGFVEFAVVEDFLRACQLHFLSVGGSTVNIKTAKNSNRSVHVSSLNRLVNEDILRQAFAEALGIDLVKDIVKVIVIREKVNLDKERFNTAKRVLLRKIEQFAKPNSFQLDLREPRSEKDINFTAFCVFNNLDEGYTACSEMNKDFYLNDERISVKIDLYSSLFIRKDVYKMCGDEVMREVERIENENREVRVKLKNLKSENVSVDFHGENVNALTEARESIRVIIRGYVIECETNQDARSLFAREGKKKLQSIMNDTKTLIVADDRVMEVSIHGSLRNKLNAMQLVGDYLQQLSEGTIKNVELKGSGKPPGVMKALMLKYGTDLSNLQTAAKLTTINLDLRNHRVGLLGSSEAISKAVDLVNEEVIRLTDNGTIDSSDEYPDCVTCFCSIETKDLYRLECCGHPYCRECITLQMDTAITNKDFPLVCGKEGCVSKFVWRDFVNLSRQGHITLAKLVNSSLSTYVSQHKDEFHYCTTPDCVTVYRVREDGIPFMCPECNVKVCTTCHVPYHDGLSCAMYKSASKADGSLGAWLMQDKNSRKICPNCTTPIEKIEGCNKMHCAGCKKYLCWTCLAVFNTSPECYGHLNKVHGNFF